MLWIIIIDKSRSIHKENLSVETKRVSLEDRQDIVIYKFIPAHSTLKLEITWLLHLHNGRKDDYLKFIS